MNLFESLTNYKKLGRSPFHIPGHKGNFFEKDFLKSDLTELEETDNLYNPKGIIAEAEAKAAKLFSAKKTLFSAGGNTLCNQTMLGLCAGSGDEIICGRNVHKSVVNAMALLGIEPIWILGSNVGENFLPGRIDPQDVEKKLTENPNAKAVFITSPDYYGVILDVKKIARVCKNFNVPLLVDNAHGSHFQFLSKDLHPIALGASLSADSAHKTLPVLTGGAWLHINDEKYIKNAKKVMALFGSTSPSYPIMASLDYCRAWLEKEGKERFKQLEIKVQKIKGMALSKGLDIPAGTCDPVRLTLGFSKIGYSASEFLSHLYKHSIEPEFLDENYAVLIPSPFNPESDWLNLEKAILVLSIKNLKTAPKSVTFKKLPEKVFGLRAALMKKSKEIDVKDSKGKIIAEVISTCPPAVPILMPGEVIGDEALKFFEICGLSKVFVV